MSGHVPIRGLFETHLTVSDLQRSIDFYRDAVGLPLALVVPDRQAAFFWIGAPGRAMLGLWSLGTMPMGLRLHIAFDVALDDLLAAPQRLVLRVLALSGLADVFSVHASLEQAEAVRARGRDPGAGRRRGPAGPYGC